MAVVYAVWFGLERLSWLPHQIHSDIMTIIASLQSGLFIIMRGTKYIEREDGSGSYPESTWSSIIRGRRK